MSDLLRTMEKEQLCSEHAALCFLLAKKKAKVIEKAAPLLLAALQKCVRYGDLSDEDRDEAHAAIEKAIGK